MSTFMNQTEGEEPDDCLLLPLDARIQFTIDFTLLPVNFSPLPPPFSVKLVFLCACSLVLLVGLAVNVLVIAWIGKGKPKRNSTDIFIVSLSITDLLSVVTTIPLQIALLTVDSNWNLFPKAQAKGLCKAGCYFQTASICISLLTLGIIAVDRYMAICHPIFHYKMKEKRRTVSVACIISIWLIGLLVSIQDAVVVRLSLSVDDVVDVVEPGYDTYTDALQQEILYVPDAEFYEESNMLIPGVTSVNGTCQDLSFFSACKANVHISSTALFTLMYVVPQLVLAFCYIRISHRLWIRKPVSDSSQPSLIKKSSRRTTIIMIVMVIAFGLLWLPYWCKRMYELHGELKLEDEAVKFDVMDMSFTILTYLCFISSPVIYMIMDRDFQNCVKAKMNCMVKCFKPSLISHTAHIGTYNKNNSKSSGITEHPSLTPSLSRKC